MSTLPAGAIASQFPSHTYAIVTSGEWLTIKRVPIKGQNGELSYYDIRIRRKVGDKVISVTTNDAFSRAQIYQAAEAAKQLFGAMSSFDIPKMKVTFTDLGTGNISCGLKSVDSESDPSSIFTGTYKDLGSLGNEDFKTMTMSAAQVHQTFFTSRQASLAEEDILHPKYEFLPKAAPQSKVDDDEEEGNDFDFEEYLKNPPQESSKKSSGTSSSTPADDSSTQTTGTDGQQGVADVATTVKPPTDYLSGITWQGLKQYALNPQAQSDTNYKTAYEHLQALLVNPKLRDTSSDHQKMFKWLQELYSKRFEQNLAGDALASYQKQREQRGNALVFRSCQTTGEDFQLWRKYLAAEYVLGFIRNKGQRIDELRSELINNTRLKTN